MTVRLGETSPSYDQGFHLYLRESVYTEKDSGTAFKFLGRYNVSEFPLSCRYNGILGYRPRYGGRELLRMLRIVLN